jgi:hypothetical protein
VTEPVQRLGREVRQPGLGHGGNASSLSGAEPLGILVREPNRANERVVAVSIAVGEKIWHQHGLIRAYTLGSRPDGEAVRPAAAALRYEGPDHRHLGC